MKLDSEEQRQELLDIISTITWTVTTETIGQTQEKMNALLEPIRNAEIEPALSLDTPAD